MLLRWKIRLRADRALDSVRFAVCLLTDHRFPDTETACTTCDARRVEHWGGWVIVNG